MAGIVGILQAGAAPKCLVHQHGDYPAMFGRLLQRYRTGLTFRVYRTMNNEFPKSVYECDAWLITGSRHSVLEALPWMKRLATFIRIVIAENGQLAGICFGHQIVAAALGGRVDRAATGWAIGRQRYNLANPCQAGESIGLNAFHQDQVVSLPDSARVVAASDSCPLSILEYGGSAITIQPHPEFENTFLKALIQYRLGEYISKKRLAEAAASLNTASDSDGMSKLILNKLAI